MLFLKKKVGLEGVGIILLGEIILQCKSVREFLFIRRQIKPEINTLFSEKYIYINRSIKD